MTSCTRFETEGLLLEERGGPQPVHFSTCPDCCRARESYRRLRESLQEVGEPESPPEGWQDRVRERIRRAEAKGSGLPGRAPSPSASSSPRHRSPSWWFPAGLAAAALLVLVLLPFRHGPARSPEVPASPGLVATVLSGPTTFRGAEDAQPGDTLELKASFHPDAVGEVRVYRNDRELLARCVLPVAGTDPAGCRSEPGALHLIVPLASPGRYQAVLLSSPAPLPEPGADMDADTAAALAAGARVKIGDELLVR